VIFNFSCPECYIESEISIQEDDDMIVPEPRVCPFCGFGEPLEENDDEEDV
jgi:hypothetical protein